jgi:hypothetical protein
MFPVLISVRGYDTNKKSECKNVYASLFVVFVCFEALNVIFLQPRICIPYSDVIKAFIIGNAKLVLKFIINQRKTGSVSLVTEH